MNKRMIRNIIIAAAALLVVAGVICMVIFIPSCANNTPKRTELDYGTDMKLSVDEEGLHCAEVVTNEKGEIENNSYGTLIDYFPAKIEKIAMETPWGNYTFILTTPVDSEGKTEATVYTLEGFEDYQLESTNPALLASAICKIDFISVVDLKGEKSSEFGFDEPRAKGTAYYNDGTHSTVILGADAAGGESCYIKFGNSDTIYLVAKENMESMLYDITDLFSASINADKTSVSDDSFSEITLGGTHFSKEITIAKNDDKALSCYYVMTSEGNTPVSNVAGSNIVGSIKSLTCEDVVCVNPDKGKLKEFGLEKPFATVKTEYSYTEKTYDENGLETGSKNKTLKVSLLASEADSEGKVYLMQEGGKLIYKIAAASVPWATVSESDLRSEYVFAPSYSALSKVEVAANGKTYSFIMGEEEQDGAIVKTVSLDGKKIDESAFYTFCQDLSLLTVAGQDDSAKTTGTALSVTYTYSSGRAADKVEFKSTGSQKIIAALNGKGAGYVYKEQVDGMTENLEKLAKGQEISSVL